MHNLFCIFCQISPPSLGCRTDPIDAIFVFGVCGAPYCSTALPVLWSIWTGGMPMWAGGGDAKRSLLYKYKEASPG